MRVRPIQCFAWFLFVGLLTGQTEVHGALRPPNGRTIYVKQCVKCHGRVGEGVKGKYDDALYGDWSIEKLTRYIDKNMPEDAPEKCVGADAEAAARYIYDAFYSPEARARNHPPRIELARLTNRQYLNTLADLIGRFADAADATAAGERGLRASYYNSRGFNRKVRDQIDREVNFDFGQSDPFAPGSPESQVAATNGFSMQWRGSLIAEETGEYEFTVKTPNGARLWVNDDATALIDASVASGDLSEHKATRRLIGGRSYPLRLDFLKSPKDKSASVALLWKPPHVMGSVIPAQNLSTARAPSTFVVSTPFPPDDSSVGYERGVAVSKAWDEGATQAAIEVANYVAKNLDRLSSKVEGIRSVGAQALGSDGTLPSTNRIAEVQLFCEEFMTGAFRRPLSELQKRILITSHFKDAPKPEDAVKRAVLLALKSPEFLYLGLQNRKPDDFEIAERLSFAIWDSLPDDDLLKSARQGGLRTREQVTQQARRMLADPRAKAKMQSFLHQWLQMNHVDDLAKDTKLYPGFTPEIIADLRTSLNLFLEDTIWNEASDYRKLLLADYLFVNDRLAEFYGFSTNATDEFVKVKLEPKERSGVVTHPYLLAAFSYPKSSSPIHRGVFLTRNIIGRALKPPPMAVAFKDEEFAPNLTMREKVAELTRSQACQSCHSVINPLGFSLEHYDAVGRFRTLENERPVDAVSEYMTDDGRTVRLAGGRDLAEFAVGSEQAQNAFIEQLFHQLVKQPLLAYGSDTMSRLRQSFVASDFNVQKLVMEIATVSALHGVEKATPSRKK